MNTDSMKIEIMSDNHAENCGCVRFHDHSPKNTAMERLLSELNISEEELREEIKKIFYEHRQDIKKWRHHRKE
ncbi:MAG: hypothetical protein Q4C43_04770 [Prevotella sp.]|nr:hypothetical protein [Prevotella sp.]